MAGGRATGKTNLIVSGRAEPRKPLTRHGVASRTARDPGAHVSPTNYGRGHGPARRYIIENIGIDLKLYTYR
ncbi:hypothetical protein SAMN04488238_103384 [Roseicitreum antarcticum]|uniref:Uncharacterized protein n=1 Tax=Roseicitreum antarcticum TaxID=564137 RepID=A0A1H2WHD8_9RHOB|nr:hypothetical protein SAMN04488238_103384 [Roseicitreum antarcticum]